MHFNLEMTMIVIAIAYYLHFVDACNYAIYNEYNIYDNKTFKWNRTDNDLDRNINYAWGGFKVPDHLMEKWRIWLEYYKRQKLLEASANFTNADPDYMSERGPGSGWPYSWIGLGPGSSGDSPPPWAYAPFNVGLPPYCYEPPIPGKCNQTIIRWAFNPYLNSCMNFTYTGCMGNRNNFLTELNCYNQCGKPVDSGCDMEAEILMDK